MEKKMKKEFLEKKKILAKLSNVRQKMGFPDDNYAKGMISATELIFDCIKSMEPEETDREEITEMNRELVRIIYKLVGGKDEDIPT